VQINTLAHQMSSSEGAYVNGNGQIEYSGMILAKRQIPASSPQIFTLAPAEE
jgi:hypothetical protein